jgi:hypothetical protein
MSESKRIPADVASLAAFYRQVLQQVRSEPGLPKGARQAIDQALQIPMITPEPGMVNVSNGYGQRTGKGFVVVAAYEKDMQIEPDTARELAMNLLAAAEAADQEAMMVQLLVGEFGLETAHVGALLARMRHVREIVGNYGGTDEDEQELA